MPISTVFSAMICLYRTPGLGFVGGKVLFPSVQFVPGLTLTSSMHAVVPYLTKFFNNVQECNIWAPMNLGDRWERSDVRIPAIQWLSLQNPTLLKLLAWSTHLPFQDGPWFYNPKSMVQLQNIWIDEHASVATLFTIWTFPFIKYGNSTSLHAWCLANIALLQCLAVAAMVYFK